MKRWLAVLVQLADEEESKTIKQDVDMFLAVASELTGKLAARNTALARQIRPRSAKPPKASTQNGPQKQKTADSSTDTPKPETGAEGSSQGLSHIQQGIQQADKSLADQRVAIRAQTYGQQDDEKTFRQGAKAIAS
ncbi:hypothetical protein [Novosphingobium sp.]|uniref:hypothetical protein n=1 Tax=Novosphingobium sp. TaxID=1874826 RepID=UPI0035B0864F